MALSTIETSGFDINLWGNHLTKILGTIPLQDLPLSLVRSYFLPSQSERSTIQGLLSSSQAISCTIEAELAKLHEAVELAQAGLSSIRTYQEFQRSLLAPIRKLPDELLSEIFTYLCAQPFEIGMHTTPIWDLQHVCMRWRSVAQSTPLLWSNIYLWEIVVGPDAFDLRLQACLRYSAKAPLNISIVQDSLWSETFVYTVKELAKHAGRWSSLEVDLETFSEAVKETSVRDLIQKQGFLQLRRLILSSDGNHQALNYYEVFKYATGLEDLTWYFAPLPSISSFPWSQLKKLIVCSVDLSNTPVSSIFQNMHSLEVLSWMNNYFVPNSVASLDLASQAVTLPQLSSFRMEEFTGSLPKMDYSLIPMIRVPGLNNLKIEGDIAQVHTLMSMLRRSNCSIKQLKLQLSSPEFTVQVLKELSGTIEQLILVFDKEDDGFGVLSELIWGSLEDLGATRLLSSLRVLDIGERTPTWGELIPYLLNIMRSRSPIFAGALGNEQHSAPAPLSLVRYATPDMCTPNIDILLELGKELGIKVDVDFWFGDDRDDRDDQHGLFNWED